MQPPESKKNFHNHIDTFQNITKLAL
uniref:Uncharacterized protein n=1 Tax=Rhizophora mucronata TaxID=61149 RepID=A0A2P2NE02_RHIMU